MPARNFLSCVIFVTFYQRYEYEMEDIHTTNTCHACFAHFPCLIRKCSPCTESFLHRARKLHPTKKPADLAPQGPNDFTRALPHLYVTDRSKHNPTRIGHPR